MLEKTQIVKLDYIYDIFQYMNNIIMYNQDKLKSKDYIYYSPNKEFEKIKNKYSDEILKELTYLDHDKYSYFDYFVHINIWFNILDYIHELNDNRIDIPDELKDQITNFINTYKNIYNRKYIHYDKKI